MAAKKAVLQLSIHHEERTRKKVFVTVSRFPGVTSITIDDKAGKLTVVGEIDVSVIVMKLRKLCNAEIVSVDDVKPPEKKPEPEKPAPVISYPFVMNSPYSYNPACAYADPYYHQPNTCVIM
ncbi:hypothetical protein CARUB_v10027383mg [Capsella rubella]|uniref:HMA domain-containing protein n=1 Tax=Capsella rubella TaxID=81985 RepID=R0EZ39_9BRAS|nr:heavy metal-associated isoprenylated plant protein 14 [Capsella rubella]EOA14226.1 hypothetical protein CARUB_v10027383mg [Capsella rubella]